MSFLSRFNNRWRENRLSHEFDEELLYVLFGAVAFVLLIACANVVRSGRFVSTPRWPFGRSDEDETVSSPHRDRSTSSMTPDDSSADA